MLNIIIKAPEGVFDISARTKLAKSVTEVAQIVGYVGDHPAQATSTWVHIDEVKPGTFFAGGLDPLERLIPIVVFFHYPAGALNDAARTGAVSRLQDAISAAKPANDPRPVKTSVIMTEAVHGSWESAGVIGPLPELAKAAGDKPLRHPAAASAKEPGPRLVLVEGMGLIAVN